MYRHSLRLARPAVRSAPRLVRAAPSARGYSTGNNGEQPKLDLKRLALGGAAVGLVAALAAGYARKNPTRLDGVPCVEAIESFGAPWEPVHAIEQDDPKVSSTAAGRRPEVARAECRGKAVTRKLRLAVLSGSGISRLGFVEAQRLLGTSAWRPRYLAGSADGRTRCASAWRPGSRTCRTTS